MINDHRVRDAVNTLLDVSIDAADRDDLAAITALNATVKAYSAYVDMRVSRRANELKSTGESEGGFEMLLGGNGSGRDAKAAEERDRACGAVPGFEDALADGDVSAEHVDVLARLTKGLSDAERVEVEAAAGELLAAASADSAWSFERRVKALIDAIKARTRPNSDVEELERQRAASSVKRWTDRASGMKMTLIGLDPIRDAQLHAVFDAKLARLRQEPANATVPFEQLKIRAVLESVTGQAGSMAVAEIVIHVDAQTHCGGRHAATMCETVDGQPVPVATMQRYCCEAAITAVIVEADGTVRNLVEQRLANRQQRRVLEAMYATCAHPHCTVAFSNCRIHHVVWVTHGGSTVVDNLLPLCETHHHLVHEGGWNVTMTPDRDVTWRRPDGSIWMVHASINRRRERRRSAA